MVNATGVFADALRRLDDPGTAAAPLLTPSQGTHIVLDRSFLPGTSALLVPRTDDGRVLFTIPWHDRVLVGTTDTPVAEPSVEPRPGGDEIAYLLDYVARYLVKRPGPEDIRSTFAGLRPLLRGHHPGEGDIGAATARLSREHAVVVSPTGLVTVTGGKWTTYRRMAADAIDHAIPVGGLEPRPCATAELRLHGWDDRARATVRRTRWRSRAATATWFRALAAEQPGWDRPIHPRLPYRMVEVAWAARHEAARRVEDVLARRTRALFLDARASIEAAPAVAALLAAELGRDDGLAGRRGRELPQTGRGLPGPLRTVSPGRQLAFDLQLHPFTRARSHVNGPIRSTGFPVELIDPRSAIGGRIAMSLLKWAVFFLVFATIAALFGFGGLAHGAEDIARVLFFVFLVVFALIGVLGMTVFRTVT